MKTRTGWLARWTTIVSVGCALALAEQLQAGTDIRTLCANYEDEIQTFLNKRQYLEAIRAAADYEQALLAEYPQSTFEMGLYQNQAHHLSSHSPFDGWTEENLKALGMPDWLPAVGWDVLLCLKGEEEEERFLLFAVDLERIAQRLGGEELGWNRPGETELRLFSQAVGANFGMVKSESFERIGDHRALVLEIATPCMGPSVVITSLVVNGRFYGFVLSCSASNRRENENKLRELIKTADFRYKPPDDVRIKAIREKVADVRSVPQLLRCIRELAQAGEFGAAAVDVSKLRLTIAGEMPKPEVTGNVARHPAYGILLTNPDPSQWKLSTQVAGGMDAIVLEDRFSVGPSGLLVGVLNTVLAYGPQGDELLSGGENEDQKKAMLALAGQNGLKAMGGEIESERFRMFKGEFVYEGMASLPVSNTKAKVIVMPKRGHIVLTLMLLQGPRFEQVASLYETILDKHLRLGEAVTNTGAERSEARQPLGFIGRGIR